MQIKLTRGRNIKLVRRNEGDVLTVGEDIAKGQAETLVSNGDAKKLELKRKKGPPENKAVSPSVEIK